MALPASLSQVWTAIGDKILADTDLNSVLQGQKVYYTEGNIIDDPSYPCIRMQVISPIPNVELSGFGDFEVRLQIDVFGPSPAVVDQIAAKLAELLDIPRSLPAGLSVANWHIRSMLCRGIQTVTGAGRRGGVELRQKSTDWTLKLTRVP